MVLTMLPRTAPALVAYDESKPAAGQRKKRLDVAHEKFNRHIKMRMEKETKMEVLDVEKELVDLKGGILGKDGLHPTAEASSALGRRIAACLRKSKVVPFRL